MSARNMADHLDILLGSMKVGDEEEFVIFRQSWYSGDGKVQLPKANREFQVKSNSVVKSSWPFHKVKVLSQHGNLLTSVLVS